MSITPRSNALNCLILALKHSAKALVERFTKKFRTPSWCSVKVEIIAAHPINSGERKYYA